MEINIKDLMETAIEEMKNGQHTEASKHFDLVVVNDSTNIDAPFFRAYCNCYDIKLGEMSNAAIMFTNAFDRYVDAVKNLNDPIAEKEKLNYAVSLLTELVSMYQLNAKRNMLTTPSIGISISTAALKMNTMCMTKLKNVGAEISSDILAQNATYEKSNNNTMILLIALAGIGVGLFILWMMWGVVF